MSGVTDLGYVAWWDWQAGKRPPGWTPSDETRWRGDGPFRHPIARRHPEENAQRRRVDELLGQEICNVLDSIDDRRRPEYERGFRNLMLAPTLEIYLALQAGEAVPIDQLRPEAVKAYGLRQTRSA